MGEGSAIPTDPHHTPTIIQPSTSQPQKKQRSRRPKRKDTEPSLLRIAEQDRGGGPKRQETMGDTIAQTRSENVSKLSNDPLLARVIDLEKTKTAQAQEITSLKLRVEKLEKKGGSKTHKIKRLYKVGRSARIVSSDEASLGDWGRYGDKEMFDTGVLDGDEVLAESKVTIKDVHLSVDEVTLAQALAALKIASTRSRAKGLIIHKQEQAPTATVSSQQPLQAKIQDNGKAKMIKPEPVKKLSKRDQLKLDEEVA
ncbi:hypothetical protein Tco_1040470 [Tanacetum coccineum]